MILPILWTPASIIGYWGQLNISDYPEDIFTAKKFIQENIALNETILNFPWHSYMACGWTYGKITSNKSTQLFYPANILRSDNIEIAHLYSNSSNPVSKDIDTYLKTKKISLLEKNTI